MQGSEPLSRYLVDPPRGDRTLAFRRDGELDVADFRRDVASLVARLRPVGPGRYLAISDDSYAAAVGLFALAQVGGVAVLPPNRQPDTLADLAADAVAVVYDAACAPLTEALVDRPAIALLGVAPLASGEPLALDRDAPLIEFRTSGTTGGGRPVVKALRHLEDEVVALEAQLGPRLPAAARIFATASHQHIYGLLFRVLWPLASGRPFQAETLLHHQELLPRIAAVPHAALVTTPVHLKRLAESENLRRLCGICAAVYSSGGPLDAKTAEGVAEQLGAAPYEIFGSTETGGVAVRRRDEDGEVWRPLPGVGVRIRDEDGRLEVDSPYVSAGEPAATGRLRARMGDRAVLASDSGFLLLGRVDRTVKIAEKRLSLPEMERLLAEHADVAEAALVVLEVAGRRRVHAAVVPTDSGRARCEASGRRGLGAVLGEHLARHFDQVLLPCAWRVVDALPRDAQDKLPASALAALFADRAGLERPRTPRVVSERRGENDLERRLEIPEDLAQLEGHFDAFPVVAGVVQLGWVLDAAAEWLGHRPEINAIEALKFPTPLRPGGSVGLRLERAPGRPALRFRLHDGERVHAVGRARLADSDAAAGDS